MADKGIDKRLKLTITEVKERQPVGDKGAVKLAFKAKGEEGDKELSYFTFSTRLFDYIKVGEIDCDVNISKREWTNDDGEPMTFTDRKVTQIYIGGQPVGGSRQRGGYYQDSPGKIASIEAQKRADIIAQLWIAGKFTENDPEVKKLRAWLMIEGMPSKTETKKLEQPKTSANKDWENLGREEESVEDSPTPTEQLLAKITEAKGFKSDKTARSYLVKSLRIEESRIDTEPEKVWEEIKDYFA